MLKTIMKLQILLFNYKIKWIKEVIDLVKAYELIKNEDKYDSETEPHFIIVGSGLAAIEVAFALRKRWGKRSLKILCKSNKVNNNLFRAFIEFYWLRPENAAVKYYQSHTWSDIKWKGKSIDICCGDGVYVFLHQGGRFNPNFDCFTNTNPNFSHEKKFIDIYDYSTVKYKPRISKKPKKTISLGTDWKNGMISK
mgnify:CR=1 FL=1